MHVNFINMFFSFVIFKSNLFSIKLKFQHKTIENTKHFCKLMNVVLKKSIIIKNTGLFSFPIKSWYKGGLQTCSLAYCEEEDWRIVSTFQNFTFPKHKHLYRLKENDTIVFHYTFYSSKRGYKMQSPEACLWFPGHLKVLNTPSTNMLLSLCAPERKQFLHWRRLLFLDCISAIRF